MHVARLLLDAAERWPTSPALRGARTVSYDELARLANRARAHLARDHAPGTVIGLLASTSPELVAAWFGASMAGLVVVPLSTRAPRAELEARIAQVGIAALVVDEESRTGLAVERGLGDLSAPVAMPASRLLMPEDGAAMMLFTSATTGTPKAVVIEHASLSAHSRALGEQTLGFNARDVVLGALPLGHSFGFRMCVLAPFAVGASTVLVEGRFDAAESLRLATEHEVTWLPGVPTMFARWADTPGRPWPALRWCLSAGAPLPEPTRLAAERRLGAEVRQGYGMTEASFCAIDAPPHRQRPTTCGSPTPGVSIRIHAPDVTGLGEIQVRGINAMRGYLNEPPASDAWFATGDLGRITDGALTVVDRLNDVILRGGFNVYPSEVEAALMSHAGVLEVAVVGRPHPTLGEDVVGVVVARPGFDPTTLGVELDAHARTRISDVKVPRAYAFVDTIPHTRSRKLARRALRDAIASGELKVGKP